MSHTLPSVYFNTQNPYSRLDKRELTQSCYHICRQGTFIAFDAETPEKRDAFVKQMRLKGVNMGGCGEKCKSLCLQNV